MKRNYGWTIVAAGALMTCVAVGAMFSLAVFLPPMSDDTGWSRAGISTALTFNFLAMGVAGFGWGAASDRYGPRIVTLIGAVLLGLGLVWASRATSLIEFQLIFGVLVGVAAGSMFAPMMATTASWFDKQRGLAVALVSAGMGVAPMTISPFAGWLLTVTNWRTAQLIIGIGVWVLLIPAALLVKAAPATTTPVGAPGAAATTTAEMSVGAAFRSPQFIVLALTFFACCAMHSGPIVHTISYAISCGVPPLAAVSIYSVEGLAGLGGRFALGMLADRAGVKRVIIGALLLQAFAAGSFVFAGRIEYFYASAAVFGFAYGGVMPLYAVLAREYFGPRILGTVLGAAAMISSGGMALGPAAGGLVFDTYGTYVWLYVGSFIFGLLAAAIALAFPPAPSDSTRRLEPRPA